MSEALTELLKIKELCDKHPIRINRTHVYGVTTERHFDEIVSALDRVNTPKKARKDAKAKIDEWQGNHDVVMSIKAYNQLVKLISGE
jgi:hypothetical protein